MAQGRTEMVLEKEGVVPFPKGSSCIWPKPQLQALEFQLKVCVSFAHLLMLLHDQDGLGYAPFKYMTAASVPSCSPELQHKAVFCLFVCVLTHPFFLRGLGFWHHFFQQEHRTHLLWQLQSMLLKYLLLLTRSTQHFISIHFSTWQLFHQLHQAPHLGFL